MSDPVTNVEIEDVLSSIRKLVSDDPRPVDKGTSASGRAKDRLVLTPDFRVPDPEPTESETALVLEPENVVDSDSADETVDEPEEDTAAESFDAYQDALSYDALSDDEGVNDALTDDATADEPDAQTAQEADVTTADADEDAPMSVDVAPEQLDAEVVKMVATGGPTHLENRIAELEAAVAQQDESWDPDGLDDSDQNTPEALQSSVADVWETVEPDEIPAPAAAEDAILEAEEDLSDDDDDDDLENFVTEDDAMLDEEALREMVSELVRQELQGTLGARITRNVRKLVRREIHRIMDSKDFD